MSTSVTTTPAVPEGPRPLTPAELQKHRLQLAGIVGVGALLANGAFIFLSKAYWEDRARRFGPDEVQFIGASRQHFAVFSIVVTLAVIAAILRGRVVAHLIAGVAAIGAFVAAVGAHHRDLPGVVPASCAIIGVALPALAYFSWHGSRAAWSGLGSLVAVLALVLTFGAPKLAALTGGAGLWTAMILPGVLLAALIGIVQDGDRYADRSAEANPSRRV